MVLTRPSEALGPGESVTVLDRTECVTISESVLEAEACTKLEEVVWALDSDGCENVCDGLPDGTRETLAVRVSVMLPVDDASGLVDDVERRLLFVSSWVSVSVSRKLREFSITREVVWSMESDSVAVIVSRSVCDLEIPATLRDTVESADDVDVGVAASNTVEVSVVSQLCVTVTLSALVNDGVTKCVTVLDTERVTEMEIEVTVERESEMSGEAVPFECFVNDKWTKCVRDAPKRVLLRELETTRVVEKV